MDETLDLRPLATLLPLDRAFTPGIARAAGLERSALDRLHRAGLVRRVLRGVYAATGAPDTADLPGRRGRPGRPARRGRRGPHCRVDPRCGRAGSRLRIERARALDRVSRSTPGRGRDPRAHRSRRRPGRGRARDHALCARRSTWAGCSRPDALSAPWTRCSRIGSFTHTQLLAELARMAGFRRRGPAPVARSAGGCPCRRAGRVRAAAALERGPAADPGPGHACRGGRPAGAPGARGRPSPVRGGAPRAGLGGRSGGAGGSRVAGRRTA